MNEKKESRSFSRIETRLPAYARLTDPEQKIPLLHSYKPGQRISELQSSKEAGMSEGLKHFLEMLDYKLDMLLSLQSTQFIKEDFPYKTEVLEISAAGLKCLKQKMQVETGSCMEFVLLLAQNPVNMATVIGRVNRIEKREDKDIIALEFTHLRESDKENIFQFVFREQREQIRTQKYE